MDVEKYFIRPKKRKKNVVKKYAQVKKKVY